MGLGRLPRLRSRAAIAPADRPKHLSQINVPPVQQTRIPVNPSDPIAVVNNQIISRQQLADECVAREGKKILDLLVNRTLIEQALARKKLSITAAEIDEEIDEVAAAVRHRPRGLAQDPGQGAWHQPVPVRPRDHLSGAGAAEALLRTGSR